MKKITEVTKELNIDGNMGDVLTKDGVQQVSTRLPADVLYTVWDAGGGSVREGIVHLIRDTEYYKESMQSKQMLAMRTAYKASRKADERTLKKGPRK